MATHSTTKTTQERKGADSSPKLCPLDADRIQILKSLSICTWNRELGLLEVIKQKGRHWSTHGHSHMGKLWLLPAEAIFLMECGVLEITLNEVPLSLQAAYHSLLLHHMDLDLYQVYSTLKRGGYIVMQNCLTRYCDGRVSNSLSCSLCLTNGNKSTEEVDERIQTLQVYQSMSSHTFSKTNPPPSTCSVITARPDDYFPAPEVVEFLNIQHNRINVCIVDGAALTYCSVTIESIQSIL